MRKDWRVGLSRAWEWLLGPVPASEGSKDGVGERRRMVLVGVLAVFFSCSLFAVSRFVTQISTGLRTPWWANAAGAFLVAALYSWYRRAPVERTITAASGTAVIATAALLIPLAYGMSSTIWWLSLVGFAMVLMGRSGEAIIWGTAIPLAVAVASLFDLAFLVPGAAGETPLERNLARVVFTILLIGMAAGFRRIADERARALQRASAARSRFLANVSHEIRTPLHGVLSMTELALRSPLPGESRAQIETANESARLLLALLNNILDITRADSKAVVLRKKPFDLHATVGAVLRPMAAPAVSKGLTFSASAEKGLPRMRRGDPQRVSQIVMNLVSNAVKFTRNGGITLRLESLDGGLPGAVVLTVSDTGPGIEASRRQEIFEPFSQGTATSSQAGSGLGLAIVRDLSRHMNGDASVVERPGGGSVFQVTLVIPTVLGSGEGPEDLLAIPPVAYPVAENPQPGRGLTVLVCEDDAVSQRVIAAMLDKLGHRATIAASAEEALEILERQTFDILVTDLRLPGIDGLELAKHVRNGKTGGDRKLPIIAATAETSRDETARLLAAGIDGHLQKPFMIPDLDRALRAATEVRLRESPGAPSSPFTRPV